MAYGLRKMKLQPGNYLKANYEILNISFHVHDIAHYAFSVALQASQIFL